MANKASDELRNMSADEYDAYLKQYEAAHTATIQDLIDTLTSNFKPTDKICYMDCVEGVKNDCTYIKRDDLGQRFFSYVLDFKKNISNQAESAGETPYDAFPYVDDNDVILI